MPVPTLLELAKRQIIRNIDKLEDVGELPYDFLRPVLIKIENPEQLKRLEQNCPQIAGADAEIWRGFIKRDILHWEKKQYEPRNPTSWWKVYRKLKREAEEEYRKQEEALRAALQQRADEKAKNTTTISTKTLDPRKMGLRPPPRPTHTGPDRDRSILSFATGSRTKTTTSRGVMDRVKRETMEAKTQRKAVLATPTHLLQNRASAIRRPPQGMVAEHNKPAALWDSSRDSPSTKILPPRSGSVAMLNGAQTQRGGSDMVAREQKLRALTGAQPPEKPPTAQGSSVPQASLPPDMMFKVPRSKPTASPERVPVVKRKRDVNPLMPNKRGRP